MWIWWWQNICHTCHMTPERCLLEVGRRVQGGRQMGDKGGNRWEQIIRPVSCTLLKEWMRRRKAGRLGVVVHTCDLRVWEAGIGRSRYWGQHEVLSETLSTDQNKATTRLSRSWKGGSEGLGSIPQHPPGHSQLQSQGNQCPLLLWLAARHSHDAWTHVWAKHPWT